MKNSSTIDITCPYAKTITKARDTRKPAFCLFFKIKLKPHHNKKARPPTTKISVKNSVYPCNNTKSILKAKRENTKKIPNKTG